MKINTENKVYDSFKAEVIKEIKKEKEYNGWSNYETWVFKLWIDNDQELYNDVKSWCSRCYEDNIDSSVMFFITEKLKKLAENLALDFNQSINYSGLASDLLGRALQRINYNEIARVILKDYNNDLKDYLNNKESI